MKVAIVHDWLTGMRGGEKVLEELCDLFPGAPIFTLFHIPGSVSEKIESHPITTSFLQKAPLVEKNYRNYLPLFPRAMERLNLQEFDMIVSSSHCVAKGVIPSPSAFHLCYCHTPMRYIWSHYDDYFGDHRTAYWKRKMLPRVINYLRSWDVMSNDRVQWFVANSKTVADRIQKYYGRDSSIIHPSVDLDFFQPPLSEDRHNFYLIVSALVPYKRIDFAIEAFNDSPYELVIVGSGPDQAALKRKVRSPKIKFLGRVEREKLLELYQTARALIQPGIEDFGINMVEAIACGCPVIAYAAGGAIESVQEEQTGLFFNDLKASNLLQTVDKARTLRFNNSLMRESVLRFSPARFKSELNSLIQEKLR